MTTTSSRLATAGRLTISGRLAISAAAFVLMTAASAVAAPAYVTSTVNLRTGAGTDNEIVAKIPAGSLVDATNCTEWCEVEWQDKKGFSIATALDRSGRVPTRRRAAPRRYAPAGAYVVGPPVVYEPPVYYGYRPYYRPYWGYRRWRHW
jgi:uncharacterized protein YraI